MSFPLTRFLLRLGAGEVDREFDAPWMCAERKECKDAVDAFGNIGRAEISLSGAVERMKSAKSRVDSVTTRASRASKPLLR